MPSVMRWEKRASDGVEMMFAMKYACLTGGCIGGGFGHSCWERGAGN